MVALAGLSCLSSAFAQGTAQSPAASEDRQIELQVEQAAVLLKAGRAREALDRYLEPAIAAFEQRYKDESVRVFAARGQAETLVYLLEVANAGGGTRAVVIGPASAHAYYLKAYALIELRQLASARPPLQRALALSPRNAQYLSEWGYLQIQDGDLQGAAQTFKRAEDAAREFSPAEMRTAELTRAWRGAGYVLIEQNRLDEAEKMYRRSLELDAEDSTSRNQLKYIDSLRRQRAVAAVGDAASGSPPQPASAALLDHLYAQLEKRERTPAGSGTTLPSDALTARDQLRKLGGRAWPVAPRIASLLAKTETNQYDLGWTLMMITPALPADSVSEARLIAAFGSATGADRLVELAKLGRLNSPAVLQQLQGAAADRVAVVRLMALIGLGYAGKASPETVGSVLGESLKDSEKFNRSAAANSVRLLGAAAYTAVPALIEYLKTRDNVYMACAALKPMPLSLLLPARAELEKILGDASLTEFQKRDAAELLLRIETERQAPTAPARKSPQV
jgi:tetratricopeptide (TPR) repeat protein